MPALALVHGVKGNSKISTLCLLRKRTPGSYVPVFLPGERGEPLQLCSKATTLAGEALWHVLSPRKWVAFSLALGCTSAPKQTHRHAPGRCEVAKGRVVLGPGDVLVLDNLRTLHGRAALQPVPRREDRRVLGKIFFFFSRWEFLQMVDPVWLFITGKPKRCQPFQKEPIARNTRMAQIAES